MGAYIILFLQQINVYTIRNAQTHHLLFNNRIGIMNFCSSLDTNIIHVRLLKCLLQRGRLRVLKEWKLNTNINKENACIQALISKMWSRAFSWYSINTDYKRNRKAICITSISTWNVAATIRIWVVLWFLNKMAMVQTAFTQTLHVRKWPLTK